MTSSCSLITSFVSYKVYYVQVLIKHIGLQTTRLWYKQYYLTVSVTCTDCATARSFLVYLAHTVAHYTVSHEVRQHSTPCCVNFRSVRVHTFHNNILQLALPSYHIWALWHQTERFNDLTLLRPNKNTKYVVYNDVAATQNVTYELNKLQRLWHPPDTASVPVACSVSSQQSISVCECECSKAMAEEISSVIATYQQHDARSSCLCRMGEWCLGRMVLLTSCSSRSYSVTRKLVCSSWKTWGSFTSRWRVTHAVVIHPDAPILNVQTVLDGDVAGGHLLPCAQYPPPCGTIHGFSRATSLLCRLWSSHIDLLIFAFYKSIKRKPVGYRISHKCWLWNWLIKYYFQV
jgi:hypothetical protein